VSRSSPFAVRRVRSSAGFVSLLATIALLLAIVFQPASPRAFAAVEQTNEDGVIVLQDPANAGAATPYPSVINFSGLAGTITEVTVGINGLSHRNPGIIDMMLVGPNGNYVLLMSNAGSSFLIEDVDLIFKDGGLALTTAQIASDTYRPTRVSGRLPRFPASGDPAPPTITNPYSLSLGTAFNQASPNGNWYLYVAESGSGGPGQITSWSLNIKTVDLAVAVSTAPTTIIAGTPLSYSVTARNNGTELVADANLVIPVPANTTLSTLDVPDGWSCDPLAAGTTGDITCTNPSFASNAVDTFNITVDVDKALATGSTLTRTAAISSAVVEGEAATANNSASQTTTVSTLADLTITSVTSDQDVNAGATFTTIVKAQNNGPSNAANTSVTLPVPANTTFVSVAAPAGWQCTEPAVGATGETVCSIEAFVADDSVEQTFTTVAKVNTDRPDEEVITSTASITSDTPDPTPGNNLDSDTTTVATLTDLAVTVSDSPDPVSANSNLTYSITVTNNGFSNAKDAKLMTTVENGTVFVSLSAPEGWTCETQPDVNTFGDIECTNPSFGVTSATFTMVVRVLDVVAEGAKLPFTAKVSTATPDSNVQNDVIEEETTVTVESDMVLTVSGVAPIVQAGNELTYQLKVNNSGPLGAEGIVLTTAVPANTTFVEIAAPEGWSCTAPDAGATGAIRCEKFFLEVGDETIALTVQVGIEVPNKTEIELAAGVTVEFPKDPRPANNEASLSSIVDIEVLLYLPVIVR
jgi:uncharacterized repeat protein (TIGR01451 family)